MAQLDVAASEIGTDGQLWQSDDVAKERDSVVLGHSAPIGEADPLINPSAGQTGAISRTRLSR